MQTDNLLALQRSAKPIRNPFKFDFDRATWNKEKLVLPGDGKWYTFVGPLADHIAKHLWMLITYRLYDMEVAKLKAAGRDRDARKFNLSDAVKNKVWMAITGKNHPNFKNGVIENEELDIDFSILDKSMKEIDQQAVMAEQVSSVSAVLEQSANEALSYLESTDADSSHVSGGMSMGQPVDPSAGALPTQPLNVPDPTDQVVEAAHQPMPTQAPAQPQAPEFPGVAELK